MKLLPAILFQVLFSAGCKEQTADNQLNAPSKQVKSQSSKKIVTKPSTESELSTNHDADQAVLRYVHNLPARLSAKDLESLVIALASLSDREKRDLAFLKLSESDQPNLGKLSLDTLKSVVKASIDDPRICKHLFVALGAGATQSAFSLLKEGDMSAQQKFCALGPFANKLRFHAAMGNTSQIIPAQDFLQLPGITEAGLQAFFESYYSSYSSAESLQSAQEIVSMPIDDRLFTWKYTFFGKWAHRDSVGCSEFLSAVPRGVNRDLAIAGFTSVVQSVNSSLAEQWRSEIENSIAKKMSTHDMVINQF